MVAERKNRLVKTLLSLTLYLTAAIVIARSLPIDSIAPISRLLVPSVAIMAAGIFPSMTLVVGAMRGVSQSYKSVRETHSLLTNMLKVLRAAFVLSLLLIFALVALVALEVTEFSHLRLFMFFAAFILLLLADRIRVCINTFSALLNLEFREAGIAAKDESRKLFERVKDEPGLARSDYGNDRRELTKEDCD